MSRLSNTLIRWILMFPAAAIAASVASGMIVSGVLRVVSQWALLAGLAIGLGAAAVPVVWMLVGLHVAPSANKLVKWILIVPLVSMCLQLIGSVIAAVRGTLPPVSVPLGSGVATSLSATWQLVFYTLGFTAGTVVVASRDAGQIAH